MNILISNHSKLFALFVTALLLVTSSSLFAQVAAPSLDPANFSDMPIVGGWRDKISLHISAGWAQGESKSNNEITSTHQNVVSRFVLNLQIDQFAYSGHKQSTQINRRDTSDDILRSSSEIYGREGFSYRFGESFLLGIWGSGDSADFQESDYGLGFSWAWGERFYLAWGMLQNKQDEIEWIDQYQGLALYSPRNYRVEFSRIQSPEVSETLFSKSDYSTAKSELEWQWDDLALLLSQEKRTYSDLKQTQITNQELGIAWLPEEDWTASFYAQTINQQDSFQQSGYRLNIGTIF